MANSGPFDLLGRVLFWRYQRGGWQYDILCGVILVFIFLTPKSVFDGSYFSETADTAEVTRTGGQTIAEPSSPSSPEPSRPQSPED